MHFFIFKTILLVNRVWIYLKLYHNFMLLFKILFCLFIICRKIELSTTIFKHVVHVKFVHILNLDYIPHHEISNYKIFITLILLKIYTLSMNKMDFHLLLLYILHTYTIRIIKFLQPYFCHSFIFLKVPLLEVFLSSSLFSEY